MTWPSAVATTTLPLATAGEDVTGEAASYFRLTSPTESDDIHNYRPNHANGSAPAVTCLSLNLPLTFMR